MSSPQTIPALVLSSADQFAARSAIEDGALTLTFSDLAIAAGRAARAFMAAGVRAGDRVGVWAPNIHEWVVAALGIQSAGGVWCR